MKATAALLAVLTIVQAAAAQEQPARSNIARSGTFSVMQIATTDPQALFARWAQPTPGVQVSSQTAMKRHQPIATFIVFSGCTPDADGRCNISVDFETTDPRGALHDRTLNAKVWAGPAPPSRAVELSEGGFGLQIEDEDPLGPYTVRATVTDHVSGRVLQTSQVLTATP